MAKARAIIKRRKSIQNIRKITRTMELIATARFKKALDRAVEAEAYTRKIAELVADLGQRAGGDVSHPLLDVRQPVKRAALLVLTSNRGLAGGYNGNVLRVGARRYQEIAVEGITPTVEMVGKRGINYFRFRGIPLDTTYTGFDDRPQFSQVEELANRYINQYIDGTIDHLDVAYTKFYSTSRQIPVLETLLPMRSPVADVAEAPAPAPAGAGAASSGTEYEFLPDARSILEEIVPVSFKVRLFKSFLDAAVSEQIARMVAMKGATENADEMTKSLTRLYNRARQSQITRELAEIIGGAAALE